MAADMINQILQIENKARIAEENAEKQAQEIITNAEVKSKDIYDTIVKQAESEATLIITEAHDLTGEIIKQAESIAKLRERKVITEVEKKYPDMMLRVLKCLDISV